MLTFVHSCTECVGTDDACGWCIYNKLCRGTADDCTDSSETYWLRVSEMGFLGGIPFPHVHPLLYVHILVYCQYLLVMIAN